MKLCKSLGLVWLLGFLVGCASLEVPYPEFDRLPSLSLPKPMSYKPNFEVEFPNFPTVQLSPPRMVYPTQEELERQRSPRVVPQMYVHSLPDFRQHTLAIPDINAVSPSQSPLAKLLHPGDKAQVKSLKKKTLGGLSLFDLLGGLDTLLDRIQKQLELQVQHRFSSVQRRLSDQFLMALLKKAPQARILDRTFHKDLDREALRIQDSGLPAPEFKLYVYLSRYGTKDFSVKVMPRFEPQDFVRYQRKYRQYLQSLEAYCQKAEQALKKLDQIYSDQKQQIEQFFWEQKQELTKRWENYEKKHQEVVQKWETELRERQENPFVSVGKIQQMRIEEYQRDLDNRKEKENQKYQKMLREYEEAQEKAEHALDLQMRKMRKLQNMLLRLARAFLAMHRYMARMEPSKQEAEIRRELRKILLRHLLGLSEQAGVAPKLKEEQGWKLSPLAINSFIPSEENTELARRALELWWQTQQPRPQAKKAEIPKELSKMVQKAVEFHSRLLPPRQLSQRRRYYRRNFLIQRGEVELSARLLESKTGRVYFLYRVRSEHRNLPLAFEQAIHHLIETLMQNSQ